MLFKICELFCRRFAQSLVVTIVIFGSLGAQTRVEPVLLDERYFQFHDPYDFFESSTYEGSDATRPSENPFLARMANFLRAAGVPILTGEDANLQSAFDLYSPFIHHSSRPLPVSISGAENSEAGFLYMDFHDTAHLFAGIPGPRLSDLEDPEAAREQLIRILLKKEQFATSWSFIDYIQHYWNWRFYVRDGRRNPQFRHHNRNIYSGTKLSREENVDAIGHMVHGNFRKYVRLLFSRSSAEEVRATRNAGVPLAGPSLYRRFGHRFESHFYRWMAPLIEPVFAYFRKGGYKSFLAYSEQTADAYLQDWYVQWSEDFQFGMPLDEMEAHVDSLIEDMKLNRPVGLEEEISADAFPIRLFKTELQLLGRKIAEAKAYIATLERAESIDTSFLDSAYTSVLRLHEAISEKIAAGEINFEKEKGVALSTLGSLQRMYPAKILIPIAERESHLNYENYWTHPTSMLLDRFGADNAAGAPDPKSLKGFHKRRKVLQESRLGRWFYRTFAQLMFPNSPGGYVTPSRLRTIEALVDNYDETQADQDLAPLYDQSATYVQRFSLWIDHLRFQIERVAIPQVFEMPSISQRLRNRLITALQDFENSITRRAKLIENAYREESRPNGELADWEFMLTHEVDRGMAAIADLLTALERRRPMPVITKILGRLQQNTNLHFTSPEEVAANSSVSRNLSIINPTNTNRLKMLWKFIKDFRFGIKRKPVAETLGSFPWSNFLRYQQEEPDWVGFNLSEFEPEEDAIFVLAFNHEHTIADGKIAISIADKLRSKLKVLTTRNAWPQFKGNKKKDPNLIFTQDGNFYRDILTQADETDGRFMLATAPEGLMPFWYTQAPLMAKPGAFVIARKLAHQHRGKRKVYLVEVRSNGLANITHDHGPRFRIEVKEPQLVPDGDVSRNDDWVAEARIGFEDWINESRGLNQIDLIGRDRNPDTGLYRVGRPQAYLPFSEWYGGESYQGCQNDLRAAIQSNGKL